jgi:hypothetical protein
MDKKTIIFALVLTVCTVLAFIGGRESNPMYSIKTPHGLTDVGTVRDCLTDIEDDRTYTLEQIDAIADHCLPVE